MSLSIRKKIFFDKNTLFCDFPKSIMKENTPKIHRIFNLREIKNLKRCLKL